MVTSVHGNAVDCIVEYNNEITGVTMMAAKFCLHTSFHNYPIIRRYLGRRENKQQIKELNSLSERRSVAINI
jgi:hypothetical protein